MSLLTIMKLNIVQIYHPKSLKKSYIPISKLPSITPMRELGISKRLSIWVMELFIYAPPKALEKYTKAIEARKSWKHTNTQQACWMKLLGNT